MQKIVLMLLALFTGIESSHHRNNACRNYFGYFHRDSSSDCYYEPDQGKGPMEICARHNVGQCERHRVVTQDGYVLTTFRIRRDNPKGVVILQHPILSDSRVWMSQSNDSTAFLFSRAGYDVWLPNIRGTYYSKQHVNLTVDSEEFWDFSFHEVALHDLKALIDMIRNKTDHRFKLIYVGHSMATTESLVYATLRPKEALENLRIIIHTAPIAFLANITPLAKFFAHIHQIIWRVLSNNHIYGLVAHNFWIARAVRDLIIDSPHQFLVSLVISAVTGWTPTQWDPSLVNLAAGMSPSEISTRTLVHYAQLVISKQFQMYDYGPRKNKEVYGSQFPRKYPLEQFQVPYYMFYSTDDWISDPTDAEKLYSLIPDKVKLGRTKLKGINHVDFHYGKDRITKIYNPILEILERTV